MYQHETLLIPGPVGLLEVCYEAPKGLIVPEKVALINHPHPLYGGNLHNKVVYTLARAYLTCGIPAVRFHYRGVSKSEGHYGQGLGETDDAEAVAIWLRSRHPQAKLCVAGFSFGGFVAANLSNRLPVEQLLLVAPAVTHFTLPKKLNTDDVHVFQGEKDDVVPEPAVRAWVASVSPTPSWTLFPHADHFFHNNLPLLKEAAIQKILAAVANDSQPH